MFTRGIPKIGVLILLTLALLASLSVASAQGGESIGTAVTRDQNALSDSLVIALTGVPLPAPQTAYEGWLVTDDGSEKLSTGILRVVGGNINATFVAAEGRNLVKDFQTFVITVEPVPDPDPGPSSVIAYSDVLHPGALVHIRHLLVRWPPNPDEKGIVVGLREQTNVARIHAGLASRSATLVGLKQHAEHMVNIIEGKDGPNYGDLDGNGSAQNPGDGWGVLNYAKDAAKHAGLARDTAPTDATVQAVSADVIAASNNVTAWVTRARDQALLILGATNETAARVFARNAQIILTQASAGVDADSDGTIEPIAGEAGAATVYLHSQNLGKFEPVAGPPAPPKPPEVGDPLVPAFALAALIAGLVLSSIGGLVLMRRRRAA